MSEQAAVFNQLNLIVRDMDAALAFYRLLGLAIVDSGGDWPPDSGARHVAATMPNGATLEFDNQPMAAIWHPGRQGGRQPSSTPVIGFSLASRDAVDERYALLTAAGYEGRLPPHDAFWGARYAIVADPDGNEVGLMSPRDPQLAFVPQA